VEKISDGSSVAGLLQEGNILQSVCWVDIANLAPAAVQKLLSDHVSEHRTLVVLKVGPEYYLCSTVSALVHSTTFGPQYYLCPKVPPLIHVLPFYS
jgi:hypothetical protein